MPPIKYVLRLCTVAAVLAFIVLQIVVRRSRGSPPRVQLKSESQIARIGLSQDSYPCLLVERSGQRLQSSLTNCLPALHNDAAIEQYEVDLRSGRFTLRQTDVFVPDNMPLTLTRGYRLWDQQSRAFGVGGNHVYDIFPYGDRFPYTFMELLLADGVRVHYDRISEGTSYVDDVNEHRGTSNSVFENSQIAWNHDHWDLTFRNGTLFRFPEAYYAKRGADGALVGMRNPAGEEIRFFRDNLRNLKSVTSPHGHWIHFAYDSRNRILEATDDGGSSISYSYDSSGRLADVKRKGTVLWRYSYDEIGMTSVGRGGPEIVIVNRYARGRIASITIENSHTYRFDYLFGPKGNVIETRVTDPDGNATALRF